MCDLHDAVDDLEQVFARDLYALEIAQEEVCVLVVEPGHIGASQYDVERRPYIMGHLKDLQESGRLASVLALMQQIVRCDTQQVRQLRKQGDIRVREIPLPLRNSFIRDVQPVGQLRLGHSVLCAEGTDVGSKGCTHSFTSSLCGCFFRENISHTTCESPP